MRVIGSPDSYTKYTDGMGGTASSTSNSITSQHLGKTDEQSEHDGQA